MKSSVVQILPCWGSKGKLMKRVCHIYSFVLSNGTLQGTGNSHSLEKSLLTKVLELVCMSCMHNIVVATFNSPLKAIFLRDTGIKDYLI